MITTARPRPARSSSVPSPRRWRTVLLATAAGLAAACAGTGPAETAAVDESVADAAVSRGLAWLAAHQDEDGRFDCDGFMKHDADGEACDGAGSAAHDVGATGLATLAFLAAGNTLDRGEYADQVARGIAWLRSQQDEENGLIGQPGSVTFIYDHAIATLAMVEAAGHSDSDELRPHAQSALDYLEYHRNPYSVWRYQPRDGDNDTSVTSWAVQAYHAGKAHGFEVNDYALQYASNWFQSMTDENGRVGYSARGGFSSRNAGDHAVEFPPEKGEAMTAAALFCSRLIGVGEADVARVAKHEEIVLAKPPQTGVTAAVDHYYWFYGSQAMAGAEGSGRMAWRGALVPTLSATQRTDGHEAGSWDPAGVWGDDGGRIYSTALCVMSLAAPKRLAH